MSIQIRTLASGSEGNALVADFDGFCLMIDAGIRSKAFNELTDPGVLPSEGPKALLLTHEHSDHCLGLAAFMKRWDMPVYASRGTFEGLAKHSFFSKLPKERFHLFKAGEGFILGPLTVQSVPISHDAAEPVAYRLEATDYVFGCLTDLGCFTEETVTAFQGVNALLLEANHNRRILEAGPYPYWLKQRVDSDRGHLCNEMAGAFIKRIYHPGLREVMLGHLSRTNNFEPLARETVLASLREIPGAAENVKLFVAPAKGLSERMGRPDASRPPQ